MGQRRRQRFGAIRNAPHRNPGGNALGDGAENSVRIPPPGVVIGQIERVGRRRRSPHEGSLPRIPLPATAENAVQPPKALRPKGRQRRGKGLRVWA